MNCDPGGSGSCFFEGISLNNDGEDWEKPWNVLFSVFVLQTKILPRDFPYKKQDCYPTHITEWSL
jgi:hypothetical protein